jgi:4-hydroxyphenylpyruvate dioxygenase
LQTAIATVSLPGTLDEKVAAMAAAGFRGVEIFGNDLLSFNGTPAEIRRLVGDLGVAHDHLPAVPRFRGHAGPGPRPQSE